MRMERVGSKGAKESLLYRLHTNHKRHHHECMDYTTLSWAGAEIESRCSRLCVVHLAARVTEWPVGGTQSGLGRKGLAADIGNRQVWEADVV